MKKLSRTSSDVHGCKCPRLTVRIDQEVSILQIHLLPAIEFRKDQHLHGMNYTGSSEEKQAVFTGTGTTFSSACPFFLVVICSPPAV